MNWQTDFAHSELAFTVRHMMISKVRGRFESFDGAIDFDPENPEMTSVQVEVEVDSINTREEDRDNHLRSADFFNAEKYPVMRFESTRVEQTGEKEGRLYGDLTIKDVTKEIVLDVTYAGMAKSPWGSTSAGFSASGAINRKDWGLNWNQALETGGVLVGDKVQIDVEVELIKQEEEEAAAASA